MLRSLDCKPTIFYLLFILSCDSVRPSNCSKILSMGSVLFDVDCDDLWQISRQQAHQADPQDANDRIAVCPSEIGKGYKRDIELRNGIDLTFHHYQLNDDLVVDRIPPGESSYLEWMFVLSSGFRLQNGVEMNQ